MKRVLVCVTVAVALSALGGCSMFRKKAPKPAPAVAAKPAAQPVGQSAPIRIGVSSVTVEKMAQEQGCRGGQGAGLVGEPGPVEVYRMQCADGKVFTARCELRQCKKM